jgi:hypothetical protein
VELAEKLREAFSTSALPEWGSHDRCLDEERCHRIFANRCWWDVDLEAVMHSDFCFSYMPRQVTNYVLPAYFTALVIHADHEMFVDLADRVLSQLEWEVSVLKGDTNPWSTTELEAISEWLRWIGSVREGLYFDEATAIERSIVELATENAAADLS